MDRRTNISAEEADARKLDAMRRRHDELRDRLLNPSINKKMIDVDAVGRQVQEKQARRQKEIDDDREYAKYIERNTNAMMEMDLKKKESQREYDSRVADTWRQQIVDRESRDARDFESNQRDEPVTSASVRRMDGEDKLHNRRVSLQQYQMRKWVDQDLLSKEERKQQQLREEQEYADHVKAMVNAQTEREHKLLAEKMERDKRIQMQNQQMAAMHKSQSEAEKSAYHRDARNMLVVPPDSARDVVDHNRSRRDHFKGFTDSEYDRIRSDQVNQLEEKRENQRLDALSDRRWAQKQDSLVDKANRINYSEQEQRRRAALDCQKFQQQQIEERRRKLEEERQNHSTMGESSFNDRFGTSLR